MIEWISCINVSKMFVHVFWYQAMPSLHSEHVLSSATVINGLIFILFAFQSIKTLKQSFPLGFESFLSGFPSVSEQTFFYECCQDRLIVSVLNLHVLHIVFSNLQLFLKNH